MLLSAAFAVVGTIFLLLFLHPFTTYPFSLVVFNRVRRPPPSRATGLAVPPDFAICVCAYNEEGVIHAKIENMLEVQRRNPATELLVYVDAATDRTGEILGAYSHRMTIVVSPVRCGKTHGMNLLSARAKASVLVFSDANVTMDLDALSNLKAHFADPSVGCVCGSLIYTNADASVTAASGSIYWQLEEWIKNLEQQSGSIMGADGSLFAVRRALRSVPPEDLIDDMYVSLMVICEGHRVIQAMDVRAFERSATSLRDEFLRKARIACQAVNVHRVLWPQLRRLDWLNIYKYVSHKWLRWFGIFFLTAAAACFLLSLLTAGFPVVALALVVLALIAGAIGYYFRVTPFAQMLDIIGAFCGVGLGVIQSMRGERYQTWAPAASVRDARPPQDGARNG
jgi:cellulose synthase/poly-beta-1,6-N-acetylglucosamine synthase-like glycosyltransferase